MSNPLETAWGSQYGANRFSAFTVESWGKEGRQSWNYRGHLETTVTGGYMFLSKTVYLKNNWYLPYKYTLNISPRTVQQVNKL